MEKRKKIMHELEKYVEFPLKVSNNEEEEIITICDDNSDIVCYHDCSPYPRDEGAKIYLTLKFMADALNLMNEETKKDF